MFSYVAILLYILATFCLHERKHAFSKNPPSCFRQYIVSGIHWITLFSFFQTPGGAQSVTEKVYIAWVFT